jgi:CheY-like chemotaxis protein
MSHYVSEGESRLTAVICDDDPVSRRLVREVLAKCGYEVIAGVDNAIEALNVVLEFKPDLLVLDLVLNGLPGEEIIGAIHDSTDTTVIVHTSYDPRFAVKSGARHFTSKGNPARLESTVRRVRDTELSA